MLMAFVTWGSDAAVVSRTSRASISRSAQSTIQSSPITEPEKEIQTTSTTQLSTENTQPSETKPKSDPVVVNKSSQFDATFGEASSSGTDSDSTTLADIIRSQRAALDAAEKAQSALAVSTVTANKCDAGLRSCMAEKCGTALTNCANDTDTAFGTKLDSCRRTANCDANEFRLLSAEIKADRETNTKLKLFNDILDCGQDYNDCITEQCGNTYSKCIGKSAGDAAISKCASIANRCKSFDNGLQSRTMTVFANLRQIAEKQIPVDEAKLYDLRDQMRSVCAQLGAMFDERTLDCVYTVNFRAGDNATIYASKKLYAGNTFNCTPDWFGIDITTFKENAYRFTREQKSATAAAAGAGIGMTAGAATSGALSRAIQTQKAAQALKDAEQGKTTTVTTPQNTNDDNKDR